MSESIVHPVPESFAKKSNLTAEQYQELYQQSISDPETFWAQQAERFVDWYQPWSAVSDVDFATADIQWFQNGKLNVSYNCLDRHLDQHGDKVAIIWEGDDPEVDSKLTYRQLHQAVCKLANGLKARGVTKGDRVCIYMPMVPEAAVAMLACARIGAVHSIVFGGFSPESLKDRILDSDCRTVITADEGVRGGRSIPLKENTDLALASCPNVANVVVVRRTGNAVGWTEGRDCWYHELVESMSSDCEPEVMDAEDPLFILYTSGSTGKPKGVLHTTGGYLVFVAMTHHYVFDAHDDDIYWCTADVGWVTGHSYIVYGPLCNRATTLMFEGVPNYPDSGRFWQVVDKHQVSVFYTAPTAIRAIMAQGDEWVEKHSRKSLRLLGSVGEPINPEAWEWYFRVVGDSRCPIVDTWWQTETGGILISPLPGATPMKPGSASYPFFGIQPVVLDKDNQQPLDGAASGVLAFSSSWPGQLRTVYGDHDRFFDTYFKEYPGYYFSGDGVRRDEDGYYWITGRVDDVLNISGHRMGTAEVESALVLHDKVAEAAVVGFGHEIKGQGIYAFVTLMHDVEATEELRTELVKLVRSEIGAFAAPDVIQWAPALPKTRSGKIMRRILRKIATDEVDTIGDTSTLADPSVVEHLVENREQVGKQLK